MTGQELASAFDTIAEAPDVMPRLRRLVLSLAARGRLVPQDPREEPASTLLERIRAEKTSLLASKTIRKTKESGPLSADEKPFELPSSWRWVRLGSVLAQCRNGVSVTPNAVGDGYPLLRISAATSRVDAIVDLADHKFGELDPNKAADFFIQNQDILICRFNGNLHYVGRAALVEGSRASVLHPDKLIRVRAIELDQAFLRWVINAEGTRAQIRDVASTTAGNIGINGKQLQNFAVPIPPLAEQHRIVAKVDELMGLIDRLEAARNSREATRVALRDAALAALREADSADEVEVAWQRIAERMDDLFTDPTDVEPLRQTVLQLAVRGRLVPQDAQDDPVESLIERVAQEQSESVRTKRSRKQKPLDSIRADDAPFEIPITWKWTRLGDLIVDGPTNGWSPKTVDHDTGVRTLKLSATTRGWFDERHFKFVEADLKADDRLWLRPDDLLIQRSNTPHYVGIAAVYDGQERSFIYPDLMMRCRLSPSVSVAFTHAALIAPFNRAWFAEKASGTSQTMVKVNQQTVRSTLIPLPPAPEQHRIVAKIDELMGLLDRLEERLVAVSALHRAFAGAAVHGVAA